MSDDEDIYPCMLQCINCQSFRNKLEDTNYSRFHKICTSCRYLLIDNKVQKCNICKNSISIYKAFPPQPSIPSSNTFSQTYLQQTEVAETIDYTNDYSSYGNMDIEQSTNPHCNVCYEGLTAQHFQCSHNICYSCLVNKKCTYCRICYICNESLAVIFLDDDKKFCQRCYESNHHSIFNQFVQCQFCSDMVKNLEYCSNCNVNYCIACFNTHLKACSHISEFKSNITLSSNTNSSKHDFVSIKTQYSNCHKCNNKQTSDKCKMCSYAFCNCCLMPHLPCSNKICIRCKKSNNTWNFFDCIHFFCQSCLITVITESVNCPYCD